MFFTQNNCIQEVDLINVLPEANQQVNPKLIQVGESLRFLGKDKSCRKLHLKVRKNKPSFTHVCTYIRPASYIWCQLDNWSSNFQLFAYCQGP